MLRSILLSIVCFAAGYSVSIFIPISHTTNNTISLPELSRESPYTASTINPSSQTNNSHSQTPEIKPSRAEKILAVTQFKPAKTAYEAYQQLFILNGLSEDELKDALTAIPPDKKTQRANIVWMLATRIPDHAISLAEELTKKGEGELARTAIASLAQVRPKQAWTWIKENEALMESMIPNLGQRYDFKIGTLFELARKPESKWDAYEEAQILIATGPKKADKYMLQGIARSAAELDPEEALNRALMGSNGKKDENLLTGVLNVFIQTNTERAKEIIELYPESVDETQISQVAASFVKDNRFTEAYDFVSGFKDTKQRQLAQSQLANALMGSGQDKVIELVRKIRSDDEKIAAIGSVAISMGVNGAPIIDRMKLMDETLSSVPATKKLFTYAYTLKDLRLSNPADYTSYMAGLRSRDQAFAEQVEQSVAAMTRQ